MTTKLPTLKRWGVTRRWDNRLLASFASPEEAYIEARRLRAQVSDLKDAEVYDVLLFGDYPLATFVYRPSAERFSRDRAENVTINPRRI